MTNDGRKAGDRKFVMDLPALVQGIAERDRGFVEQAVVSTICAEEAVVHLKTKVEPGTKVRLSLHVPRTFLLETPLDLNLTGTVADAAGSKGKSRRGKTAVRIRLDRSFRILPASA